MIAMTFRVSELESFRQWRDDEEADLDLLLSRMRGQTEPSEAMLAGTAFHKALETAPLGIAPELEAQGYTFRFTGNFDLVIPPVREVRAGKTYTGDGWSLTVSGQLDTIEGKRVEDHKTTGRFDPERYLGGYQWRYYLDIFGADQFRWNVFEIAVTDDPRIWEVYAHHTLEQWRYPGMEDDCRKLAADLARFAAIHLPERNRRQAVPA
jgi:hypothetical protein